MSHVLEYIGRVERNSVALGEEVGVQFSARRVWPLLSRPMKRCIPLLALLRLCYGGDTIDPQDLVRRAGMTMQSDWAAAPGFAFVQRDFTASKGVITQRQNRVMLTRSM